MLSWRRGKTRSLKTPNPPLPESNTDRNKNQTLTSAPIIHRLCSLNLNQPPSLICAPPLFQDQEENGQVQSSRTRLSQKNSKTMISLQRIMNRFNRNKSKKKMKEKWKRKKMHQQALKSRKLERASFVKLLYFDYQSLLLLN